MSIIVSSGRFKKMRIDKATQKEMTLDVNVNRNGRYNPEDQLMPR